MFARLLPRSAPYFEYFARQNSILQKMTSLLSNELSPGKYMENNVRELTRLEAEADELQHTIIHELSQTFITPIDREDIYAISTAQERAIDSLNSLGTRFYLFSFVHVRFPAKKCVEDMYQIARAVGEMLDCLKEKRPPSEPVARVHSLKENCEMLLGVGLGELQDTEVTSFEQVKQLMVWTQLYERIEQTLLLFSELTDTLEQAVLKYA